MTENMDAERCLAGLLETAWPEEAAGRARALLAEFGSVAGVLAAPGDALRRCLGADDGGIATFLLNVRATLDDCSAAEGERILLPGTDALAAFLQTSAAPAPGALRILYLNARNVLLGDETIGDDLPPVGALEPGTILRRALELGATAVILLGRRDSVEPAPRDLEETSRLVRAADTLDIVIHDRILAAAEEWRSFRRSGLLV